MLDILAMEPFSAPQPLPNCLALAAELELGKVPVPDLQDRARAELLAELDRVHAEAKRAGDADEVIRARLLRLAFTGEISETEYRELAP